MKMLKYQGWHVFLLTIMLCAIAFFTQISTHIYDGSLWGLSTQTWFVLGISIPIIHQVYVLLCWRYELYYKRITKAFGPAGFTFYKIGFAILILLRPIIITVIAISNQGTTPLPESLQYGLSVVLFIPAVYLFYSVKRYFGIDRAFGRDHFYPEDYRNQTYIKGGIFKYTSNGMYIYGFFIMWIPALLFESEAALVIALFNHLYIWVHYYCTELPDIREIYAKPE